MGRRIKKKCDWCKRTARYEHLHAVGRSELACEEHHQGCTRCRPIGGDKYYDKKKLEDS
jgi:hypothetical protein